MIIADKQDLKQGKEYSHNEVKHLFPEWKKDRIQRARVTTFKEMDANSRIVFSLLDKQIREKFPDAVCYAGGSRINGNWKDDSDYDLNIYIAQDKWKEIRNMKFEYKVDLHFKIPQGISIRQIV